MEADIGDRRWCGSYVVDRRFQKPRVVQRWRHHDQACERSHFEFRPGCQLRVDVPQQAAEAGARAHPCG